MTYFVWDNSLSTGHERIDDDHRKLFSLINTFHKALDEGRGQQLLGRALDALVIYYKVHFDREEAEMLRINYPKFLAHKLEHEKFMNEVNELKKNFNNGTTLNPTYVGRMLSDWLRDHIAKVDTQLAKALELAK
jgi:hemerythrin